jgi:hypothetical protein
MYPCNRLRRPIGLRDVKDPTMSRQSAHRLQWDCQPYAPAVLYSSEICFFFSVSNTHFCYRLSKFQGLVWLEGLGKLKTFNTSLGLEPATFRLVAWFLNKLRCCVAPNTKLHIRLVGMYDRHRPREENWIWFWGTSIVWGHGLHSSGSEYGPVLSSIPV